MNQTNGNLSVITSKLAELQDRPPDTTILTEMLNSSELVTGKRPNGLIGGIDSSDNLLLNIPDHPGAAIAGYSFSLVISDAEGQLHFVQERMAEKGSQEYSEPLEIALVYSNPLPDEQRILHIADYQLRNLINTPSVKSPYDLDEIPPEFKVRFVAARHRETTERRAVRTSLFHSELEFRLLLKDGRHSSQNVSTRYSDDIGRRAVEQNVRYVGVVKQGTLLWSILYPYHKALFGVRKSAYWTLISPSIILQAYTSNQADSKTIRLGAQENQSLGGIGGAWILYGNGPRNFYVLEFNVYDLAEFHPLVESGEPLEHYNKRVHGWQKTYVTNMGNDEFIGTQMLVSDEDIEYLINPTVGEIHYLANTSFISPGYPIVLADAHNRCKITGDRKDRLNAELITELQKQGYHPVDFETWSEDPHKIFER
ncbi:MAG: hypothetical protein H6667_13255 [Ardenticatenaceae bacterium]|nr:hypothetical protein [Ardenticatenaceae bacterium]MCB9442712.1 hypothetical protein [Ardenticatenaceae bacterium]